MALQRNTWWRVIALTLVVLNAGCSSFYGSRKLEVGPFAENVTALVGDAQSDLFDHRPFYMTRYLQNIPAADAYAQEWVGLRKVLRGVLLYSSQVVSIGQSPLEEGEKPKHLAHYINRYLVPPLESGDPERGSSRASLAAIAAQVDKQKNLLDALGAAQPMVDRTNDVAEASIARLALHLTGVVQEVTRRMDERWIETRANLDAIVSLEQRAIQSFVQLHDYRRGSDAALAKLRQEDPMLGAMLAGGTGTPTGAELDAVEKRLMERLKEIREIDEQLRPRIQLYLAEARERDELVNAHQTAGRKVRIAMLLWSRSHRNLASGVAVPPDIDVYKILSGAASKVVQ